MYQVEAIKSPSAVRIVKELLFSDILVDSLPNACNVVQASDKLSGHLRVLVCNLKLSLRVQG